MSDYRHGDIYASTGTRPKYLRIGAPSPHAKPDQVYVQDSDGAGFILGARGRHLTTQHLDQHYRLHHRAPKDDQ